MNPGGRLCANGCGSLARNDFYRAYCEPCKAKRKQEVALAGGRAYEERRRAEINARRRAKRSGQEYRARVNTPAAVLNKRMSEGLRSSIKGKGGRKWQSLVGYTPDELTAHLERQFMRGMGWHNLDQWHIDHIQPLASFAFHSFDCPDFRRAWALTNLRPLWASENLKKKDSRQFLL